MATTNHKSLTVVSPTQMLQARIKTAEARLYGVTDALELLEASGDEHAGLFNLCVTEVLAAIDLLRDLSPAIDSGKAVA